MPETQPTNLTRLKLFPEAISPIASSEDEYLEFVKDLGTLVNNESQKFSRTPRFGKDHPLVEAVEKLIKDAQESVGKTDIYSFIGSYDKLLKGVIYKFGQEKKLPPGAYLEYDVAAQMANFNQELARDLAIAIKGSAQQKKSAEFFITTIYSMRGYTPLAECSAKIVNGARGQAGLMNLLDRDYEIIIPETASEKNKNSTQEVLDWDVHGGIDFAAVWQGTVFLIDTKAKSEIFARAGIKWDPKIELKTATGRRAIMHQKILDAIRKTTNLPYKVRLRYLEITLPSTSNQLSLLGEIDEPTSKNLLDNLINYL